VPRLYLYYQFLEQFNITDQLTAMVVLCFAGVTLLSLVLRISACIGYQTQFTVYKYYGKEINVKSDIVNVKSGLIAKAVSEYMKSHEKGTSQVSSQAAVNKNVAEMGFLFWKFDSMAVFIRSYENSILLIGLLLALLLDHQVFFGVMAVSLFILTRVFASLFDFDLAKARLVNEITLYLDREIGQFYTPDLNAGVNKLRLELTEAAAKQAAVFNDAVTKLGEDLSAAVKSSLDEIALDETINEWKKAVDAAASCQGAVNAETGALKSAVETLKNSMNAFNNAVVEYSGTVRANADQINSHFISRDIIEKNQSFLNESFNKFELSLQDITGKLGNSLASIIDFRVQSSYNALNESLTENIKQIVNSNNELLVRLQRLFDGFREQSAAETQAIMRIKEQMESYYEHSPQ